MSTMDDTAAGRVYVQALFDQEERTERAHEAYAEYLVTSHWLGDDDGRKAVRLGLEGFFAGYEQGRAAGFEEGRNHESRRHDVGEEMRHGAAHTFLQKLDALDAATRKELAEIATALHLTLVWSQDKETPTDEQPPAA